MCSDAISKVLITDSYVSQEPPQLCRQCVKEQFHRIIVTRFAKYEEVHQQQQQQQRWRTVGKDRIQEPGGRPHYQQRHVISARAATRKSSQGGEWGRNQMHYEGAQPALQCSCWPCCWPLEQNAYAPKMIHWRAASYPVSVCPTSVNNVSSSRESL